MSTAENEASTEDRADDLVEDPTADRTEGVVQPGIPPEMVGNTTDIVSRDWTGTVPQDDPVLARDVVRGPGSDEDADEDEAAHTHAQ